MSWGCSCPGIQPQVSCNNTPVISRKINYLINCFCPVFYSVQNLYSTISSCVYFWVYFYSYLNKLQAFILILFLLHETTNYFEKLVYLVLEWLSPAGHSTAAPSNCFLPGPASCPGVRTHPFVYLDITELGLQTGQLQPVACSPMGNRGARACLSWVLTFPIPQTKNSLFPKLYDVLSL